MAIISSRLLRFSRYFEKSYTRQFSPLLERTGLSMGELHVLLFLHNNPGCDMARDVVELRGLTKSQVSQSVEVLVVQGLLERRPDAEDRRIVRLALTPAGMALGREARGLQSIFGRRLLEDLSPEEAAQLDRLLEKIVAGAERRAKEERN